MTRHKHVSRQGSETRWLRGTVLRASLLLALLALPGAHRALAQSPDGPPPSPSAETVILRPDQDTYVSSERPDENFGGASILNVGQRSGYGATRALIRFDFDELELNEVVVDGELKLYLRQAGPSGEGGRDIVLHRVRSSWGEGSATWNNFPSYDDGRLDSVNIGTASGNYRWDIGEAVRKWYKGEWSNHGIYIQGYEANGSYRGFDSSEGSNEPELELEVEIDTVPAQVSLNPLPPFVNTPDIRLTWTKGIDPEPASGIDHYELWVSRNGEPWTLAVPRIEPDKTEHTLRGAENGRRYAFRLLAIDRAGNRPPDGPAQTETLVDYGVPTTQMTALPEWVNGPFILAWTGTDLPQGAGLANSGIKHYDLEYNINATSWGGLAFSYPGQTYNFTPVDAQAYFFRVRAVDNAGNVQPFVETQAQTKADLMAPSTWCWAESGIDRPRFTLSWNGQDGIGSGIVSYDVQYRVDAGGWANLALATAQRSWTIEGRYGERYAFRLRARDLATNEGRWPDQPQCQAAVLRSSDLVATLHLPWVALNASPAALAAEEMITGDPGDVEARDAQAPQAPIALEEPGG